MTASCTVLHTLIISIGTRYIFRASYFNRICYLGNFLLYRIGYLGNFLLYRIGDLGNSPIPYWLSRELSLIPNWLSSELSPIPFPPGDSKWIISVGDYVDNSFTALGSSDPREVIGSSSS